MFFIMFFIKCGGCEATYEACDLRAVGASSSGAP
jgi:hypothetical protein